MERRLEMARINNVDINKVKEFGEQLKSDPAKARKTLVIEGEWLGKKRRGTFKSSL